MEEHGRPVHAAAGRGCPRTCSRLARSRGLPPLACATHRAPGCPIPPGHPDSAPWRTPRLARRRPSRTHAKGGMARRAARRCVGGPRALPPPCGRLLSGRTYAAAASWPPARAPSLGNSSHRRAWMPRSAAAASRLPPGARSSGGSAHALAGSAHHRPRPGALLAGAGTLSSAKPTGTRLPSAGRPSDAPPPAGLAVRAWPASRGRQARAPAAPAPARTATRAAAQARRRRRRRPARAAAPAPAPPRAPRRLRPRRPASSDGARSSRGRCAAGQGCSGPGAAPGTNAGPGLFDMVWRGRCQGAAVLAECHTAPSLAPAAGACVC